MTIPSLNGNWVDLIIIIFLLLSLAQIGNRPAWVLLAEFLSFVGSLVLSLRFYKFGAELFRINFTLPQSVANAFGFLISAIILEMIIGFMLMKAFSKIPEKVWRGWWNNLIAVIPAVGETIVLVAFVLTLLMGLPIRPQVKTSIADSKIGGFLLNQTTGIERSLKDILGGVIEESLTYMTVKPESNETIKLHIESFNLSVDEKAEQEMFRLVNEERTKRGISALVWAPNIVPVSRLHAEDMWRREYFGHQSPDGEHVGDRLTKAGVNYYFAGENLALAPTVKTAHTGLMNSEGHRKNILEPQFKKIGIGVIDNVYYGKMFVQVFTD